MLGYVLSCQGGCHGPNRPIREVTRSHNRRLEEVSDVTGTYFFAAIALVTAGAVIGVLAMVALGISRDDRRGGFPARPRGPVARGARRVTGAGIRGPGLAAQTSRPQDIWPA